MCIENKKCFGLFGPQVAVVLIALSSAPEGVGYWAIAQPIMIAFPALDALLFILVLARRSGQNKITEKLGHLYLAVAVGQLVTWAILLYRIFFSNFDGRILCETGWNDSNGSWFCNGETFEDLNDCSAAKDALFSLEFTGILAIICLKFFFALVVHRWQQERTPRKLALPQSEPKEIEVTQVKKTGDQGKVNTQAQEKSREQATFEPSQEAASLNALKK